MLGVFKKHRKKTNTVRLLVVGVLAVATALFIWQEAQKPVPEPSRPLLAVVPSQFAKLSLDFGDGNARQFQGAVTPGMNALDALSIAAERANIPLAYSSTKTGVQVTAIGKKKAEKKKRWVFYANGKTGENPTGHQMKARDEIGWKYQ